MKSLLARVRYKLSLAFRLKTIRLRNDRPLVSFSFDDCSKTAVTTGAEILEQYGSRGTFYLSGGLCQQVRDGDLHYSRDDIIRLFEKGHEIGCHSYNHRSCPFLSRRDMAQELEQNKAFFQDILQGNSCSTFAYPYGDVGILSKLYFQSRFAACRSTHPEINSGTIDLGQLRAVPVPRTIEQDDKIGLKIEETIAKKGWLIFYSHDVREAPSRYGCTPESLNKLVETCHQANMDVLPIKTALDHISSR